MVVAWCNFVKPCLKANNPLRTFFIKKKLNRNVAYRLASLIIFTILFNVLWDNFVG